MTPRFIDVPGAFSVPIFDVLTPVASYFEEPGTSVASAFEETGTSETWTSSVASAIEETGTSVASAFEEFGGMFWWSSAEVEESLPAPKKFAWEEHYLIDHVSGPSKFSDSHKSSSFTWDGPPKDNSVSDCSSGWSRDDSAASLTSHNDSEISLKPDTDMEASSCSRSALTDEISMRHGSQTVGSSFSSQVSMRRESDIEESSECSRSVQSGKSRRSGRSGCSDPQSLSPPTGESIIGPIAYENRADLLRNIYKEAGLLMDEFDSPQKMDVRKEVVEPKTESIPEETPKIPPEVSPEVTPEAPIDPIKDDAIKPIALKSEDTSVWPAFRGPANGAPCEDLTKKMSLNTLGPQENKADNYETDTKKSPLEAHERECADIEQQPPDARSLGKGKGKAKGGGKGPSKGLLAPPPKSKGKGKSEEGDMPLGRRFHWQALKAEQLEGTVFDDSDSIQLTPRRVRSLTDQFKSVDGAPQEDGKGANKNRQATGKADSKAQGGVLSKARVQHIAIVFCRVLGLAARPEDAELLARGVELMQLPLPGMLGEMDETERLDLLASAVPSPEEAAGLLAADDADLRSVEKLVIPLAKVPRVSARLRVLRLAVQARENQAALRKRIDALVTASQDLRRSGALRKMLLVVAQLGSWINSSDPNAHRGFALSSALGKLRQFRALNGNRELTLLHVTVITAVDGDVGAVGLLGDQLATELSCLSEVAREQVPDLAQEVRDFGADASWVAAEAECSDINDDGYTDEARAKIKAIHEELVQRADDLAALWSSAREELESMLLFFAERWDRNKGCESAVGKLFQTVESFKSELRRAAREVASRPQRYLPAGSDEASSTQTSQKKSHGNSRRRKTL